MVAPFYLPPAPLSPAERQAMAEADWNAVDAWCYRWKQTDNRPVPQREDFVRLYLAGKRAGGGK